MDRDAQRECQGIPGSRHSTLRKSEEVWDREVSAENDKGSPGRDTRESGLTVALETVSVWIDGVSQGMLAERKQGGISACPS